VTPAVGPQPAHPPVRPLANPPQPRHFGWVNWRGLWTLYRRGAFRYLRYGVESIGGPAVSSLLFLAVFSLALGGRGEMVPGATLVQFIAPGIIMFSLTHSAFESAATPLIYDKMEGMIGDVIGAPLTPIEITAGYLFSATGNGLITGSVVLALMAVFVDLPLHAPLAVLGFAVAASALFALIGMVVGLWADRWDNYSAAETFLILPIGLLSGAFFTLQGVPEGARWLFDLNPVFHAVQGFRYGFIGVAEAPVAVSAAVLVGLDLVLGALVWRLFALGYKIKA
jgi:ABC-2 type transport system permease protein